LPADAKANDFVFWNTQLAVDDLTHQADALRTNGARFVSKPHKRLQALIVRDPDGHALQLNEISAADVSQGRSISHKTAARP